MRSFVGLKRMAVTAVVLMCPFVAATPRTAAASTSRVSASSTALDTVRVTGSGSHFSNIDITAQVAPFGHTAPSGSLSYEFGGVNSGPVTCLKVTGPDMGQGTPQNPSSAVLLAQTSQSGLLAVHIIDKGGNGKDVFESFPTSRSPGDCSPFIGDVQDVLTNGRAIVTDQPIVEKASITCTQNGASSALARAFTDFPPNDSFSLFALVSDSKKTSVIDGVPLATDATGAGATPGNVAVVSRLPVRVVFAVYRDGNGNHHWDPSADLTVYAGDGTVTACPSAVPVAPK